MQVLLTAHHRYRYLCGQRYQMRLSCLANIEGDFTILDAKERTLAEHRHGVTTIHECYAIDGATCAPDFRRGMRGFFVHDLYLQFLDKYPDAYPEQLAHDAMLEAHELDNFRLAKIYHWAVSGWPRKLYVQVSALLTNLRKND